MPPMRPRHRPRFYICSSCTKLLQRQFRRPKSSLASSTTPDVFDVVVVGGGPTGLSLLTALGSSPITSTLKLALVESQDLTPAASWRLPPDRYSNRASSLNPASVSFLSRIGAWPHVDESRTSPYHHMQVWDALTSSRLNFAWNDAPSPSPGPIAVMTENSNLVGALLSALSTLPSFTTFSPTTLSSISHGPAPSSPTSLDLSSYPHLTLSSPASPPQTIATRLLVGADGPSSPVRTFANIPSRGWDYGRAGVVATVTLADTNHPSSPPSVNPLEHATAFQRFLPPGPIALLPLPGPYATLVWSTTPQHAEQLKRLSEEDFAAMVDAAFRLQITDVEFMLSQPSGQVDELAWRLKHTPVDPSRVPAPVISIQAGSVASFPLRMRHADTYIAPRVALVGDAAHTIHPMAGQGLNMGLGDAEALAKALERTVECGGDIGADMFGDGGLAEYVRVRWGVNHRLLGVVDKLGRVYGSRNPLIVGARGLGVGLLDGLGWVKGGLMRGAGG